MKMWDKTERTLERLRLVIQYFEGKNTNIPFWEKNKTFDKIKLVSRTMLVTLLDIVLHKE